MLKFLIEITQILEQNKITYFLDSGTLLGLYRDGAILEGEVDIDLGVFKAELDFTKKARLIEIFRNKKFLVRDFGSHITIHHKDIKFYADLCIYEKVENNYILPCYKCNGAYQRLIQNILTEFSDSLQNKRLSSPKEIFRFLVVALLTILPKKTRLTFKELLVRYKLNNFTDISWCIPYDLLENLSEIEVCNHIFTIPTKVENYLEFRYSKSWKIPDGNWVTEEHDGARLLYRKYAANLETE